MVLLVEEEGRSRDRIAADLEARGYHVLTVETPFEAAALVRLRRLDAVVACEDVVRSHGWTVHQLIASCWPVMPHLVVLHHDGPTPEVEYAPVAGGRADRDRVTELIDILVGEHVGR